MGVGKPHVWPRRVLCGIGSFMLAFSPASYRRNTETMQASKYRNPDAGLSTSRDH